MSAVLTRASALCPGAIPKRQGRVYDLKSAYKQFGLCESDRSLLRIAVNQPDRDTPTILGLNAMPFGAVGSVAAFLRISVNIWFVALHALSLILSAYFDDFGSVSRDELFANTAWTIETFLSLLGFVFARDGVKGKGYDRVFKMLGVQVDLRDFPKGIVRVGHTPERVAELREELKTIMAANSLDKVRAEKLRGRMVFFEGFAFGRMPSTAIPGCWSCRTSVTAPFSYSPMELAKLSRAKVQ